RTRDLGRRARLVQSEPLQQLLEQGQIPRSKAEAQVTMSAAKVFLAKAGKISGPYTEHDVEAMSESGQLERFAWVWRSTTPGWQPLDPMPAALDLENLPTNLSKALPEDAPPLPTRSAPPLPPTQRRHLRAVADHFEGVCHD